MGKNLTQQKRGKGSLSYRTPGFNYVSAGYCKLSPEISTAKVLDILNSIAHTAPLIKVLYNDGTDGLLIAPSGIKVGDELSIGTNEIKTGNVLALKHIPEGTNVFGIEQNPGDGGKFVRSSGGFAKITAKTGGKVTIILPSKKEKLFNPECRASIGVVAGSGRVEKPILKAGKHWHMLKPKNRYWPSVSGASMNAVDHPFGGTRSSRKGRPTIAPRNAPPGRKVGMIRPRRTGRTKK